MIFLKFIKIKITFFLMTNEHPQVISYVFGSRNPSVNLLLIQWQTRVRLDFHE